MEQTLFRSNAGAKSMDALRRSNNSVTSWRQFPHLCWTHRQRVCPTGSGRSARRGGGIVGGIAPRWNHSNMSARSSWVTQTSGFTLLLSARRVCIFVAVMRARTRASITCRPRRLC